ncbi:MAG: HEAT repeat domain-containing protein [Planctomycetota bacterium]
MLRRTLPCLALLIACPQVYAADGTSTGNAALAVYASTYSAIDNLGYAPEDAAESVPRLELSLKSDDAQVRWRAARALGLLGKASAAAAPALVGLLSDSDPVVQVHASIALARIGDKSEASLEALLGKVTSDDGRVARVAIQTLRHLGVPPEKLAGALEAVLESDDAAVMSHAVDALVNAGAEATPLLNATLAKEKASYWAAVAIGEIGPDAAGTTPALIDLVGRTADDETRQLALLALAKIGPDARESASAIRSIAESTKDDGSRIVACYALGAIGDASASDLLTKLESTGGPFQAMSCAWSLAKLNPDDPTAQDHAIEKLVGGLMSERELMRNAAAAGIKELAPPPEKIGPKLIAAVRTATQEQKSYIALALATLGPEIVPRTVNALGDPVLRDVAIEVLGRLGADAADGVDGLIECLKLDAADNVARAQYALASIGDQAGKAADGLAANLTHEAEQVRQSALFALRQIGAEAQSATGPLQEFLDSADSEFEKYATAWALSKMQLEAQVLEKVTASLNAALESDDERVRLETIAAIRDLGPAGVVFEAKLKEMAANDPSAEVRAAAKD